VEREFFLTDWEGRPVPGSPDFLRMVADAAWTYELSACQAEHRTRPHRSLVALLKDLKRGQKQGERVAGVLGYQLRAIEVGPASMPLDIYPHDERYRKIAAQIPREVLSAACRVTGTHLHLGVRSLVHAIEVHNLLIGHLDEFVGLGDHSGGERLRLYRQMATNWRPPRYESVEHLHAVALEQGFEENPRNCWHLIRISRHGTVELRMFGMTADPAEIISWCERVREVLK
jgi:gamma-glutamyl:cysteine ligase YbdK (ATP-grasp superfamily)